MEKMKHITKLVKDLSDEEIGYLLYELRNHERVFIPQWYDSEMAQERGYRDAGHMIEVCEEVYQDIDELISDIDIPEDEDED
jgi:hypothetical protein